MKTNLTPPKTIRSRRAVSAPTAAKSKTVRKPALKTILAPTDFSSESRKAIRYATALAKSLGGQIVLLHVIEPTPYSGTLDDIPLLFTSDELKKSAQRELKTLCKEESIAPELLKSTHVRSGPACPEIVDEAKAIGADLIVIATHGQNALTRVIFGSTTERVVRHAKCPVLVVRENERDFIEM
ncbi:MAG: universal stress protein [Verrucomicrobia bacterium]|nr:universal stress protein [Verrucomicrobiota bacterium]